MCVHLTRGRQLATYVTGKNNRQGATWTPTGVGSNSLLFSYCVKRKQIQPPARNMRYVGQGEHHVFNAVES